MAIGYLDDSKLTAIADAIRTKAGTSGSMTVDQMPANIAAIPSGGGAVIEKDVNFYDWDGTLLYSYTLAEAQALSALPALPGNYKDYTADSWTETLSFVKSLTRPWMVGVNYTTTRTATYVYINVPTPDTSLGEDLSVYFTTGSQGSQTINIDWGDGTSSSVSTNSAQISHTYSQTGDYKLTISGATDEADYQLGGITGDTSMLMSSSVYVQKSYLSSTVYMDYQDKLVTSVELGRLAKLDNDAFSGQVSLKNILIPKGITFLSNGTGTYGCFRSSRIRFISIPSVFTGTLGLSFAYLPNVETVILPSSNTCVYQSSPMLKKINWPEIPAGTSIENYKFQYCSSLDKIEIPEGITSIGQNAFYSTSIGTRLGPEIGPLPSTLTTIDSGAFYLYHGPTSVFRIPASVTSIGSSAFYQTSTPYMSTIIFESSTPPTLTSRPFGTATGGTQTRVRIYVPYGAKATYVGSSSEWAYYESKIYELPQA